jgi:hypothetical protein
LLAGGIAIVAVASCDRAHDIVGISPSARPIASIAQGAIDTTRLAGLRATGEGCAVFWRDSTGGLRGFAVPRSQLPFSMPPIPHAAPGGRGLGRAALLVMKPIGGETVTMSCWVPVGLRADQVRSAVTASTHNFGWTSLRWTEATAPHLAERPQREPLSAEARAFEDELLGGDSLDVPVHTGRLDRDGRAGAGGIGALPGPGGPPRATTLDCQEYETGRGPRRPSSQSIDPSGPSTLDYGDCSCYEWEGTIWYDGDTWNIQIDFYFCDGSGGYGGSGGWGDDYGWMIDNGYWQWPCGGQTMSPVDTIRQEYFDGSLYDSTAFGSTDGPGSVSAANRAGVHWTPACGDFVSTWSTTYFSWSELKNPTSNYAVIKTPLYADTSNHYGLDYWRAVYGSERNTNSVYRTPRRNSEVQGARGSEHVRGVAADLRNETHTQAEYDNMAAAADSAQASWIEPWTGPCGSGCTHADWRWWVAWPH